MPQSVTEVAGVELAGGTELGRGRGRGRQMECGRYGRCEPGWGHAMRAGGAARRERGRRDQEWGPSRSRGAQRAERAGGADGGVTDEVQNERATYTGPFVRTTYKQYYR
jgi:hypothetical protein